MYDEYRNASESRSAMCMVNVGAQIALLDSPYILRSYISAESRSAIYMVNLATLVNLGAHYSNIW